MAFNQPSKRDAGATQRLWRGAVARSLEVGAGLNVQRSVELCADTRSQGEGG